ncbi:hypothetical protein [Rhodovibrio sodomensis]|uniref:hypothetical protein n=1 Tax=Rhodovibrio sodomensis TaxID=1088 RepID=UPI001903F71A|nr:hypothetical protein [Rhodovibrio sodomensis]
MKVDQTFTDFALDGRAATRCLHTRAIHATDRGYGPRWPGIPAPGRPAAAAMTGAKRVQEDG